MINKIIEIPQEEIHRITKKEIDYDQLLQLINFFDRPSNAKLKHGSDWSGIRTRIPDGYTLDPLGPQYYVHPFFVERKYHLIDSRTIRRDDGEIFTQLDHQTIYRWSDGVYILKGGTPVYRADGVFVGTVDVLVYSFDDHKYYHEGYFKITE